MEPMGVRIRRQRRRLGLTLDDLSARTGISKPYLSLIETCQTSNPPSDEKLIRLEQTLEFRSGELLAEAQLHRTPRDVKAMLTKLLADRPEAMTAVLEPPTGSAKPLRATKPKAPRDAAAAANPEAATRPDAPRRAAHAPAPATPSGISLDALYVSGLLRQFVERTAGNVERMPTNAVPVINRVSAGYPKDFTDLSYPKGVADAWVSCPDVSDPDAFAARVSGDSMTPKYREGDIVIFSPRAAVRNGDDAFVRFEDGQTTFKRVFFEKAEGGAETVRLQPRNEKYEPKIVEPERLSGVWRAVFKYQSVED